MGGHSHARRRLDVALARRVGIGRLHLGHHPAVAHLWLVVQVHPPAVRAVRRECDPGRRRIGSSSIRGVLRIDPCSDPNSVLAVGLEVFLGAGLQGDFEKAVDASWNAGRADPMVGVFRQVQGSSRKIVVHYGHDQVGIRPGIQRKEIAHYAHLSRRFQRIRSLLLSWCERTLDHLFHHGRIPNRDGCRCLVGIGQRAVLCEKGGEFRRDNQIEIVGLVLMGTGHMARRIIIDRDEVNGTKCSFEHHVSRVTHESGIVAADRRPQVEMGALPRDEAIGDGPSQRVAMLNLLGMGIV